MQVTITCKVKGEDWQRTTQRTVEVMGRTIDEVIEAAEDFTLTLDDTLPFARDEAADEQPATADAH